MRTTVDPSSPPIRLGVASSSIFMPPAPTLPVQSRPIQVAPNAFADADRAGPLDVRGRHVYMVGIGGCGVSGLARMLKTRGGIVSGSDKAPSPFTETLEKEGIAVGFDQSKQWLPEETELVVASAAIRPDHPQILEAQHRGIPHLSYAEALGWAMVGMTGVCVAGTHGKSTTTAMLGFILGESGLDPNVIVGANCAQLGGGFRLGSQTIASGRHAGEPGLLVVEACEFNRSFHNYSPRYAVVTSVEADHLDMYGSLEEVIKSFHVFAKLLPPASAGGGGGKLLIAEQNAHRREVTGGLECAVETIGWSPSADWSVTYDARTRRTGLVRKGEGLVAAWVTPLPGDHNAMNAATACVLALWAGADPDVLGPAINRFTGLDRRMQLLGTRAMPGDADGTRGPVKVYDDYGHHPTEVETTLRAMREFEKPHERHGRLICVFQPHQHSRTRHLLKEFASAFSAADIVIVPEIYFVRDSQEERAKVTSTDLVDLLRQKGVQAMHLHPFEAIVEQLEIVCRPGDVLIVMGAGPVDAIGRGFLKAGQTMGVKP
ncbi:MAG TPA: UDP-N-acetylmuramate--L-alanine ligase [Phycisphaerales bacterium]|nr:UDP-N-acetylmuramate--L-alanine ligase [Phycisphaerales bacterium]